MEEKTSDPEAIIKDQAIVEDNDLITNQGGWEGIKRLR